MEQLEFISWGGGIKMEDTVTQILPRNQIQHPASIPSLKLSISAKSGVHASKGCPAREDRNPEGPNVPKFQEKARDSGCKEHPKSFIFV